MIKCKVTGTLPYEPTVSDAGNLTAIVNAGDDKRREYVRVIWTDEHPNIHKGDQITATGNCFATTRTTKDGRTFGQLVLMVSDI